MIRCYYTEDDMETNIRVYHFFKDFRDDRTEYFITLKEATFAALAYSEEQQRHLFRLYLKMTKWLRLGFMIKKI